MRLTMPAGACDCHIHIYNPGHPLAPTATFTPPPAPLADYRLVQQALGLQRVVLVQATGYGYDNTCLLQALAELGAVARGVVVVPPEISDTELQALHAAGVRGVRFMMLAGAGGVLSWDALDRLAPRLADLDWVVGLQLDGRDLPLHRQRIEQVPGKLVIDHTGKFMEPVPTTHEAFVCLLSLLERPDRWVKLAAPYETSRTGPPHYADVAALAKGLLAAHPDRCLWASNWPHPNRAPRPADADLLDLLVGWTGDAALFERVLVNNPAAAYGW